MADKPIGAFWVKENDGSQFFSGEIEINGEKIRIVAFPNQYKTEAKHPDFKIFRSRPPLGQSVEVAETEAPPLTDDDAPPFITEQEDPLA